MRKIVYYVRPECGSEDRMGEPIGPFEEYLQHTYDELTAGPDGEVWIAAFYQAGEQGKPYKGWYLNEKYGDPNQWWSDLVIWGEIEIEQCSQCGQREENHSCPQR